ncbi:MAG: S26 family signal peptidase [Rikenellaceae bacterium]
MRRKIIVSNNELLDDVAALIALGEQVVLLTKGRSMLPFIVGGCDSVELTAVGDEIKLGDIILAKIGLPTPRYIIHRVINVEENKITLMGDGNLIGVEECDKSDVVARVTSIIKPNNKIIIPNSKNHQYYALIWLKLLPIRRYLLAILRRIS